MIFQTRVLPAVDAAKKIGLAALFALISPITLALGYESAQVSHDNFADLGTVTVISPATPARDLIIVLASQTEIPGELYRLANAGHLIALVPLHHFFERAALNQDECINAVTLLDVLSQHLQQQFRFAHYQRPILIGLNGAAPLALATIAQAPNHLFQAGVGIRFQPDITLPAPPCSAPTLTIEQKKSALNIFRIGTHNNPTPWQTFDDLHALENYLNELAAKNADTDNSIDDLPLVELPLQKSSTAPIANSALDDVFVILLSGDGGWANIDKDIGEQLNRSGLPVIGWNSLQYFWREKTPEQASHDLARAITHYQKLWQRPRVLLIGFSLGSDVLPFMISRLPATTQSSIADTVFLGLGRSVDFQFHVSNWIGSDNDNAKPIAPELAKLSGQPLLCIYGSEDDETMCGDKPKGMDVIELPGDHHFDGDYEKATQLILDHLRRHATP